MTTADTESVFRNLVNDIYMPGFDYLETKLSFHTVFHKDLYSYCMCRCGYDHEQFDYISATLGKINGEKFDKVLKCILDGKCPHTSQVPKEYVKEVAVYGIHVAAAVSTTQAIENTVLQNDDDCDRIKGLFKLDPCLVAVLKNSKAALHPKIWDFIGGWEYFSNVELTFYMIVGNEAGSVENVGKAENVEKVKLREISLLIFLVEQRNITLLKIYMDKQVFDGYFLIALKIACKLRFDDAIDALLNHRDWISGGVMFGGLFDGDSDDEETFKPYRKEFPTKPRGMKEIEQHCTNAIVYDQPNFIADILEEMLHQIKQNYFGNKPIVCDLLQRLSTVCVALQMPEIKKIISKHYHILTRYDSSSDLPVASTSDQVKALFSLLFEGYLSIKDKLDSFLDSYGILNQSTILDNEETLDHKIDSTTIFSSVDLLKTMFNFGLDINSVDNEGTTLFTRLLRIENITAFRDIFELAIFHNPDLSSHKSAISYALKADLRLYELTLTVKEYEANHHPLSSCDDKELYKAYGGSVDNKIRNYGYVMDAKLHGSFGHDAENSCFNFLVPFLMECGFQVSTEDCVALDSLTDGSLHPDELEYIKQYLASPRSLKQDCRSSLRRHYTGSQIHQLVELVTMPQQIKDYILLRPMLKVLSSNYIS